MELSGLIWQVADLLRGNFRQSDYSKVILPFTILRRLDCVLEPTKAAVLAEHAKRTKEPIDPEHVKLEELLNKLNDMFPEINDTDRVNLFNNAKSKMMASDQLVKQAKANNESQFVQSPSFEAIMLDCLIESMDSHKAMTTKILNDERLRSRFKDLLARSVFNEVNQHKSRL